MSYKDLKKPRAGDAPSVAKDEPKRSAPANDQPQTDDLKRYAKNNEHGSGHGHSDVEKRRS